jgi:Ni,Fe-hydrogenase III small subunit/formate hydrogenlyase subunit 6/NADH:ubiquinone oxidoreductase subunit I
MIKAMMARLQQGHRTMRYPKGSPPPLPERCRGMPALDGSNCDGCAESACLAACPTEALCLSPALSLDLGRCLFCGDCEGACPEGSIAFGKDHRLSTSRRGDLVLGAGGNDLELAHAMGKELKRLLGRSLKLRQVSAGGCNACEADTNVLNTVGWDLGRFGIQFVASPRHADGVLVTGPVTKNMELALRKTWDAIPEPKVAIAVGACAISGGLYRDRPETLDGAGSMLPVDLWIPGCPPHPLTILDGLLRLVGSLRSGQLRRSG